MPMKRSLSQTQLGLGQTAAGGAQDDPDGDGSLKKPDSSSTTTQHLAVDNIGDTNFSGMPTDPMVGVGRFYAGSSSASAAALPKEDQVNVPHTEENHQEKIVLFSPQSASFKGEAAYSSNTVAASNEPRIFHTELEVISVEFPDIDIKKMDYIYGTIIMRASDVDYVIYNRKVGNPPVINSDGHVSFKPDQGRVIRVANDITIYVFIFELKWYGIVSENFQSLLWSTRGDPNCDGKVFQKEIRDNYFGAIRVEFRVHNHHEGLPPLVSPDEKVLWELLPLSAPLISNVQHGISLMEHLHSIKPPVDLEIFGGEKEVAAWGDSFVFVGGRQLGEIFSVRFPSSKKGDLDQMYGALLIRGTGRPYVVFHRTVGEEAVVDSEGNVRLVGPDRCIEVDDYFTMDRCLFDWNLSKIEIRERVSLWFGYANKTYDTLLEKKVDSKFGPIVVNYVVYERAAEGVLSVKLVDWNAEGKNANIAVHGKVIARNTDFEDEVANIYLFDVESKEAVHFECAKAIALPLTRSTIALPLASPCIPDSRSSTLSVSVCLYNHDIKVFDDTLEFAPHLSDVEERILKCEYNTSMVALKVRWLRWCTDY